MTVLTDTIAAAITEIMMITATMAIMVVITGAAAAVNAAAVFPCQLPGL